MDNLSPEVFATLAALRNNIEGQVDGGEWGDVYLDNAIPAGMSDKVFRSHLSVLSRAGMYRVVDGYAWGSVRAE